MKVISHNLAFALLSMFQTKYFCQFLLFFFLHYSFVFSYKIDSSCATEGVEELVRRSMLSAFGMAESARRRLVSRPLDPETKELLGYMLLKENIDTAELEKPGKLNKIINIYQNIIGHFKEEVKDDDPIDEDDVVRIVSLKSRPSQSMDS